MLKERLGVLLDSLVEQRFLRPVARVTLLRRNDAGEAVRVRALDSEHPPDWSAPLSWVHAVIGAVVSLPSLPLSAMCPASPELAPTETGGGWLARPRRRRR
jgi:hypothetical protein